MHKPTGTHNTTSQEERREGGKEWEEGGNGHEPKVMNGGDVICGIVVVAVVRVLVVVAVLRVLVELVLLVMRMQGSGQGGVVVGKCGVPCGQASAQATRLSKVGLYKI